MRAVTFVLPRPLSVNGLYYNHRQGGRGASQTHRVWRQEAMLEISAQRAMLPVKAIRGRYRLVLEVERRAHRGGDLGNLEKCVSDVLVKMGVIEDDSLAEEIILRWAELRGCRVTVTEFACAQPEENSSLVESRAGQDQPMPVPP